MTARAVPLAAFVLTWLCFVGATPSSAEAARHCGPVHLKGVAPFQVEVDRGSVPCAQAKAIMKAVYDKPNRAYCYRTGPEECPNGRPSDLANTEYHLSGWRCATGAGGGGCSKGGKQISGEFVETTAEKRALERKSKLLSEHAVLRCEASPESFLIQVGSFGEYGYECVTDEQWRHECAKHDCRHSLYSESQATQKWEERVKELCGPEDVYVPEEERKHGAYTEYECGKPTAQAGVYENLTWQLMPYLGPLAYAEYAYTSS